MAATLLLACGDIELTSHSYNFSHPPEVGGFDPGTTLPSGASTSTASGYGGAPPVTTAPESTAPAAPAPPSCDDAAKRCSHLFTFPRGSESQVELRGDFAPDGWAHGLPMTAGDGIWSVTVDLPYETDVLYKFVVDGTSWEIDPSNSDAISDGIGGLNSRLSGQACEAWTCAPGVTGTFDWRDAVLYFVFVDRFLDGDPSNNGSRVSGVPTAADYMGGDYAGVVQKLKEGYFTKLGVNALWLTVPMENPDTPGAGDNGRLYSGYHGYWPSDLDKTEHRFGSMDELKGLVSVAHERGIRVILDYAMNHVHVSSPVYRDHADWFWPNSFNGQSCICGSYACGWDSPQAKRCWFADYLPDFNFTVPAARKFSVDNAIFWAKETGADGFRLDAVKHIEDSWITDLRSRVKTDIETATGEHFYMVGETFTGDQGLIRYYVDPQTKLDGQFDFPLRQRLLTAILMRQAPMTELASFMDANDNMYGSGVMSTFIGNHDVPRVVHFAQDYPLWDNSWGDGKDRNWNNQPGVPAGTSAFERLANAYTLMLTTKGIPLIYYGDEVGMAGAGDPDNRRPMQWSDYSDGQLLLRGRIEKLTAIRAAHPALRRGTRTTLWVTADSFAYKMSTAAESVYVVINRSDVAQSVSGLPSKSLLDELSGETVTGPSISLAPRSSRILTTR